MKVLFVLIAFGFVLNSCTEKTEKTDSTNNTYNTIIKTDEEGVLYKPYDGGIQKKVYTEGKYSIALCNDIIIYNIGVQPKTYQLEETDQNGKIFSIEIEIEYAIQKGKSSHIHFHYGKQYRSIIDDNIIGSVKDILAKYDYDEIKNLDIKFVENMIYENSLDNLNNKFIDLKSVTINKLKRNPKH